MKVLNLAELNKMEDVQEFRLLQDSDLIDGILLIVTKNTDHGVSCTKSTILFVNKQEFFCSQIIENFFPEIKAIQYELGGKNLIHSLAHKELLNNSLPGLGLTLFNKLHFNNVSTRLDTLREYVKHAFHPVKKYSQNPIEILWWSS